MKTQSHRIHWPAPELAALALGLSVLYPAHADSFSYTGQMIDFRDYGHTATLLPNGKVLVAGGKEGTTVLSSAELYDPATGSWAATGSLTYERYKHTATLLSNGKVLVAGGSTSGGFVSFGEIYDPLNGTWTTTGMLKPYQFSRG